MPAPLLSDDSLRALQRELRSLQLSISIAEPAECLVELLPHSLGIPCWVMRIRFEPEDLIAEIVSADDEQSVKQHCCQHSGKNDDHHRLCI